MTMLNVDRALNGSTFLREDLGSADVRMVTERKKDGKELYMKGTFIQGAVENQNNRTYPTLEIQRAVDDLNKTIKDGYSVLGEADHPDNLNINLDRVSHEIVEMGMQGNDGIGKLRILEKQPMGQIVKNLLESGIKLGVSSRGSGDVADDGQVSNFAIVTVDVVAQPSAPNAYPKSVYESLGIYETLMNTTGGLGLLRTAQDAAHNVAKAGDQLSDDIRKLIREIELKTKG